MDETWYMLRALELAQRGQGFVEPNPMVGCVIAGPAGVVGEGWHQRYGSAHAEVEALRVAGPLARGATAYVTLEPCCHQGKTGPCTQALIAAGVARVVAAIADPFPAVAGKGLAALRAAGVEVSVGLLEIEARRLVAPYLKLITTGRPWVIAKWAMTLDGKLATSRHDSRWISSEISRQKVHQLRGRVDGVMVGRGTVAADDPLLTARPPELRTATRIVLDSQAALSTQSQLVRTARDVPVLVAAGAAVPENERRRLADAGCEVLACEGNDLSARLCWLLEELGRRRMTNILVEGGSRLLGVLHDARLIDEVHVFMASKLVGGERSPSPIGGEGVTAMAQALEIDEPEIEILGSDVYVHGRVRREPE